MPAGDVAETREELFERAIFFRHLNASGHEDHHIIYALMYSLQIMFDDLYLT